MSVPTAVKNLDIPDTTFDEASGVKNFKLFEEPATSCLKFSPTHRLRPKGAP